MFRYSDLYPAVEGNYSHLNLECINVKWQTLQSQAKVDLMKWSCRWGLMIFICLWKGQLERNIWTLISLLFFVLFFQYWSNNTFVKVGLLCSPRWRVTNLLNYDTNILFLYNHIQGDIYFLFWHLIAIHHHHTQSVYRKTETCMCLLVQ